ncbi:putative ADP-ribosylation factor GTPase-activating protein AGD14 [Camellia lanceoleosa]|uniref:ADP-ribosylation factor GTPase-activating protein AGD14 n=1 Tax=Camellia lanceoleosa TaxID=1840588 RepID=A0ACC0G0A7_9ERIC|nr:putative ADP-ribosylation factor GTPase-activating protein AGD14 [Camellia lanceoleosa]
MGRGSRIKFILLDLQSANYRNMDFFLFLFVGPDVATSRFELTFDVVMKFDPAADHFTGPQYVCTTFWTFVCTSCSGVHREFTHRVKSVSMAKFKAEEVSALQAGGNERAREIYFKEWDPQLHSFPNSSSQSKLRDFIRCVYVDRKFTGERSVGRLAMVKGGDREDSFERRSIERSSPGGRIEDRTLKYYIDERGSPHYKLNNVGSFSRRNRPVNFEIVDDRFRDDRFGSRRISESHRPSNEESRAESGSPVSQKGRQKISPPIVHPVRDTSGKNGPSLQHALYPSIPEDHYSLPFQLEPLRGYCFLYQLGSFHIQNVTQCGANHLALDFVALTWGEQVFVKTASLTVPGSVDGKSLKFKRVTSDSLIEFVSDSMPPHAAATQIQQTALSTNGGNRDSVQSSTKAKVSDDTNVNSLEFLLFGLSVPAAAPVDKMSAATGNADAQSAVPVELSNNVGAIVTVSTTNVPAVLSTGDAHAASPAGIAPIVPNSRSDFMVKVTDGQQLSIVQSNQPYSSPSGDCNSATQHTTSVGPLYNQSCTSSLAPNAQSPSSDSAKDSSQASSKVAQNNNSGVGLQALQVDSKPIERKELPAFLFTSSFSPFTAPVPSWQTSAPHGMGYSMQYHPNAVPMPAFPNSAKSRNPFDLDDESTQAQVSMFPPMLPWHDTHSSQLMQPQASPYASTVSPQLPSYGMSMSPSAFVGQQLPNSMPFSGPQGISCVSGGEAAFASWNPIQQPSSRFLAPTTSNPFSSTGGNPFG